MARKYDYEYKVQAVKFAKEIGGDKAFYKISREQRPSLEVSESGGYYESSRQRG